MSNLNVLNTAITTLVSLCNEVIVADVSFCADGTFAGVCLDTGSFLAVDLTQPELSNVYEATNWVASITFNEGEFNLADWVQRQEDYLC